MIRETALRSAFGNRQPAPRPQAKGACSERQQKESPSDQCCRLGHGSDDFEAIISLETALSSLICSQCVSRVRCAGTHRRNGSPCVSRCKSGSRLAPPTVPSSERCRRSNTVIVALVQNCADVRGHVPVVYLNAGGHRFRHSGINHPSCRDSQSHHLNHLFHITLGFLPYHGFNPSILLNTAILTLRHLSRPARVYLSQNGTSLLTFGTPLQPHQL